MFWLAAALPHAIGTSVFAVAAMRSAAMSRSDLFGFARNLAEPNIFPAVWRVMLWWNASGTIERMLIAIVAATPLAWVLACWLLADAEHPMLRRTSLWLRALSTATLLVAITVSLIARTISIPWIDFAYVFDVALAAVIALHLRTIARLNADELLARVSFAVLGLTAVWGFAQLGMWFNQRTASERLYYAQWTVSGLYGVLLGVAMVRRWLLMRRSFTPAAA
jgi:hypothetical protein